MTDTFSITTGDGATGIHVKNVERDNTEITGYSKTIDISLLKQLMAEEKIELDDPEIVSNLQRLENGSNEPEKFQKALDFFLNIAGGVTIRWVSKMLLG